MDNWTKMSIYHISLNSIRGNYFFWNLQKGGNYSREDIIQGRIVDTNWEITVCSLFQVQFLIENKGQLNSQWIYEVIVSPNIPTKFFKDFCHVSLLEDRAEILKIFGWNFGRNNDLINHSEFNWPLGTLDFFFFIRGHEIFKKTLKSYLIFSVNHQLSERFIDDWIKKGQIVKANFTSQHEFNDMSIQE